MVIKIRQILFYVLKKIVPELVILKRNIDWRFYQDYVSNSDIAKNTKINSPFNLNNVVIGEYTYIDQNARISETSIGKFCSIGPNFFCGWGIHPIDGISTAPMFYSVQKQNGVALAVQDKIQERKKIYIGNDVFIGANVTLLDGVTVGDGAVIGAGAVVSKDIPAYAVAVGSPIQIIKYRFTQEQINALLNISWWNFPEEQLKDVEAMFFDVDAFIKKYAK